MDNSNKNNTHHHHQTSQQKQQTKPVYDESCGTYIYKDADGITYEWDASKSAWFPRVDMGLLARQQAAYGVEGVEDLIPETEEQDKPRPTNNKKRQKVYTMEDPNKKQKQDPKPKKNTSIYVAGLPLDTTEEEMQTFFTKCGIIMEDFVTGKPKIKLYKSDDGKLKGDGLVTYFKEESVDLAVQLLDDSEFRFGDGVRIKVQKAVFEERDANNKPEGTSDVKKLDKESKKKLQAKFKKMEKQLEWFEDEPGARAAKHAKTVILKRMFTLEELDADATLLLDLKSDVRDECEKLGEVTNVILYDKSPEGVIAVRFREVESAAACVQLMNGRWFGGKQIEARIHDGKEKYEKSKTAEDEEEEKARIERFEKWLEES